MMIRETVVRAFGKTYIIRRRSPTAKAEEVFTSKKIYKRKQKHVKRARRGDME